MIYVIGPKDKISSNELIINTTSRSDNWSKGLSPFYLGPVDLYDGYIAKNVENGWQFSKCYGHQVNPDGTPSLEYFEWAKKGWNDSFAHRYPMGKGAKPLYSWWQGKQLDYIEARKQIYIPLYSQAVKDTPVFQQLKDIFETGRDIFLWDFDGYQFRAMNKTFDQVINDPKKKMGHAFVLAMLLERFIV